MTDDLRALLADLNTWPMYLSRDGDGNDLTTVSKGQVAAAIRALLAKAEREPADLRAAVERLRDDLVKSSVGRPDVSFSQLQTISRLTDLLAQHPPETAPAITQDTSDGYHTFRELYAYRKAYNALLFNEWARAGRYGVHKAWRHSDSEPCFGGGWFIVSAQTPAGQVSNHYRVDEWELFQVPERETAEPWDGHTPQIALTRLLSMASEPPETAPTEAQSGIAEWRCVHGVELKRPCAGCDLAPRHGGTPRRQSTVEELDKMLNSADDRPVEILPDGTIASRGDASRAGTCATCVAFWPYTNGIDQPMAIGTCRKGVSQSHDQHPAGPTRVSTDFGCNQWAGADAPKENN